MTDMLEPGAWFRTSTICRFVVWAPKSRTVTLRLLGPVHRDLPMQAVENGYHVLEVDGIEPGQRYLYRLQDGQERPDPASRCQPDGVHAPSAVADSAFLWTDANWHGLPLESLILYELHIGTFTREGTFDSAIAELDRLHDLGINTISIMPVAQFPGMRNWGYDGVYPFAVQTSYGGIAGLKRLINAAHSRRMAVILDVVYNHLGPEGNYFRQFGPYFSDQYRTPWGEPFNFDGPGSDPVRAFFLANARRLQTEFHLDGLRLDAVPFIKDFSAKHFLAELAEQARSLEPECGRPFHLIGESDMNDPKVIRPHSQGGYGLSSQWSDDFHHALHAHLTGERNGYYVDHGKLDNLARAYRDAYVLCGHYSHFRGRRYGAGADDRSGEQFVIFAQNHDQVGNRPRGDRLTTLTDFETLKLIAGLLLTTPYLPMLFMGEEYGEPAPFPFFVNHSDHGLLERIRRGRKHEFAAFSWQGDIHDPASEHTFQLAKLDTTQSQSGRGKVLHDWYRELIRLRKTMPALTRLNRQNVEVICREEEQVLLVRRGSNHEAIWLVFHFGTEMKTIRLDLPGGEWRKTLDSTEHHRHGPGSVSPGRIPDGNPEIRLHPRSMVIYQR